MTRALISDIDGVISDSWGRRHHIRKSPPDWDAFFDDCAGDPTLPLAALLAVLEDWHILLVTSRPERNRDLTQEWLMRHNVAYDALYMRPTDGAHLSWKLDTIRDLCDRYPVEFIFEDDPAIIGPLRQLRLPVVPIFSGYYRWEVRE